LTNEKTNLEESEPRINNFYPQVNQTYGGGNPFFQSKIIEGDV